ncbi:MAG TPA: hypothetical protein VLE43_02025 [Candidatus Saccharimonadia bacterium]|nr:hypothetical protein [Candidatus Saccharimonadia bacterium]
MNRVTDPIRLAVAGVLWCFSIQAQDPFTPQSGVSPEKKEEAVDVLRPVTPDERDNADLLYWNIAKQMSHGAFIFPSRSPVRLMTVEFSIFPAYTSGADSGVVTVRTILPDHRAEPKGFWETKDAVRVIPKELLERLQTAWDKALTTARVDSQQGKYVMDGTVYEFRGGTGSDRYVVQAHSPNSGIPARLVNLVEVLMHYCGAYGNAPPADAEHVKETLAQLEEALKTEETKGDKSKESEKAKAEAKLPSR